MLNAVRQRTIETALMETLKVFPLTYDAREQFFDLVGSVQRRAADMGLSFQFAVTTLEILSAMERRYPTLHEVTLAMLVQQHRTGHEESVGAKMGLTPAEVVVRDLLFEAHRAFLALGEQYHSTAQSGGEHHSWTVAMGELQRMVEARPTTRRMRRERG